MAGRALGITGAWWPPPKREERSVCVIDQEGEPVGPLYEKHSWLGALDLGKSMARDRRLPLEIDASSD